MVRNCSSLWHYFCGSVMCILRSTKEPSPPPLQTTLSRVSLLPLRYQNKYFYSYQIVHFWYKITHFWYEIVLLDRCGVIFAVELCALRGVPRSLHPPPPLRTIPWLASLLPSRYQNKYFCWYQIVHFWFKLFTFGTKLFFWTVVVSFSRISYVHSEECQGGGVPPP